MMGGLDVNIIHQIKRSTGLDGAQVGSPDFISVLMRGGRRYRYVISMLWCACLAVFIAQGLNVVAMQSEKHAMEMFAKEDTNHSKDAEKNEIFNVFSLCNAAITEICARCFCPKFDFESQKIYKLWWIEST